MIYKIYLLINLQFLHNVIIINTEDRLPLSWITLANVGYPLS